MITSDAQMDAMAVCLSMVHALQVAGRTKTAACCVHCLILISDQSDALMKAPWAGVSMEQYFVSIGLASEEEMFYSIDIDIKDDENEE